MPRKGIQLAYPFEEKRLAKWQPPYIVQPKYDGDRCSNTPLPDSPLLLSSEENPFFSVPHINQQLIDSGFYRWPLDGELYNHNLHIEGGHELIHSICSRTVNLHPRHKEMEFHVFDIKWINKSQMQRMAILKRSRNLLTPSVKVAPYWICETLDDIMRVYDGLIEKKYEGIIVRHFLAPYVEKRSIYMMKFKPKKEDIYEIIGAVEEVSISGVPKGVLGALVCRGDDGTPFRVGSGLTREDRENLWERSETLKGKKVKVQYQHITSGKGVPRFPVFLEVIE